MVAERGFRCEDFASGGSKTARLLCSLSSFGCACLRARPREAREAEEAGGAWPAMHHHVHFARNAIEVVTLPLAALGQVDCAACWAGIINFCSNCSGRKTRTPKHRKNPKKPSFLFFRHKMAVESDKDKPNAFRCNRLFSVPAPGVQSTTGAICVQRRKSG
jgi:hypothetical protein